MHERPTITITGPADAVAAVPYVLGFHPSDSLVAIGTRAGGPLFARLDAPDAADRDARKRSLLDVLSRNNVRVVILLGYGTDDLSPTLAMLADALEGAFEVPHVLRVEGDRFWRLDRQESRWCPRDGEPFDSAATVVAARATFAGLVARSSRAELLADLAPVGGEDRDWMRAETERAEAKFLSLPRAVLVERGLDLVRNLIEVDRRLTDREAARLTVALSDLRIRDDALVRITHLDQRQQGRLWRDLTRRAERAYVAAPATLLAYQSYINGDGAMVNVALDRALEASPGYLLARLISQCVALGMPPEAVALTGRTPEWLARELGETRDES
ncbi:DUF4192 domain-containing protein [Actinomadura atramentaria]|uniref:DUF4192 domain-containing protein n=1 Tax=Actinomadura atramentaria TaxID=1990 RepID=UPI000369894E|nr:DUF4192 domain-containing protein [Actinomadura atramentaria]